MSLAKKLALHHLIKRTEAERLLTDFALLLPGATFFLVQPDGRLFACSDPQSRSATAFLASLLLVKGGAAQAQTTTAADNCRVYPLLAATELVGQLVVYVEPPAPVTMSTAEQTVVRILNHRLAQALQQRGLATETLERYRELNLLYRVAETISRSLDPQTLPHLMLEECRQVIAADVGLVYVAYAPATPPPAQQATALADDASLTDLAGAPYHWRVGACFSDAVQAGMAHSVAGKLLDEICRTGRATIIADLQALGTSAPATAEPCCMALCAPLTTPAGTLGAIFLGRKAGATIFTASDEKLLTALATQAAIALENAQLHQKRLEQERLRRDLELAYEVQAGFIPNALPQAAGWEVDAWWQPARTVSGDFYDFFQAADLAGPAPTDAPLLHLVGADVSGKGLPAALFMMLTRTLLRANAAIPASLAARIQRTNQMICREARAGMFVTLFYATLHVTTGELTYVNAGHNPPLYYQTSARQATPLTRTGILLGGDRNAAYTERTLYLQPGDWLLFYTDGVTEAVNPAGEPFGEERLLAILHQHHQHTAAVLCQALKAALQSFIGGGEVADDITLVVVRRV